MKSSKSQAAKRAADQAFDVDLELEAARRLQNADPATLISHEAMLERVLHGGARPGAGRKTSKNPARSGSIRLTPERWDKLRTLGMEWLSDQIDAATLPGGGQK